MIDGWIKQLDKAYNGETLTCPVCGSQNTRVDFYVFEGNVGYCDYFCLNCGEYEHFSRIKYPDSIKIKPIKL